MAIDSRDPDGDSSMASSADGESTHNDYDGAGTDACTPTHHVQAPTAAVPSELSPPGSQPQQVPDIASVKAAETAEPEMAQSQEPPSEPPVGAWKSKRAQEDYQRAMEHVIDLDFSLDEFGDPFDERDMEEKLP